MVVYLCPRCWGEVDLKAERCPHCGTLLAEYAALSYEDKLLNALTHRIKDYRIMAIRLLARMKSEKAITAFERLLDTEEDVYVVREAVRALVSMHGPTKQETLRRLLGHRSELVRTVACELARPDAA